MIHAIRTMTAEDWPDVYRIYDEGIKTNLAVFTPKCLTWEEWDASHLKDCRLILACDNDVVGWAALTGLSNCCDYAGVGEVSIYVSKTHRGQGAGKALLTEMIYRSEQSGYWMLQSDIMQDNTASIRLHEACGFRMVGYREKIGRDRFGIWRNTVLMERRSPRDDFDTLCGCNSNG